MKPLFILTSVCAAALLTAACQPEDAPTASQPYDPAPPVDDLVTPAPDTDPGPATTPPGATGGVCGGVTGVTCENEADYCRIDMSRVGVADASGVCTIRPQACTMEYRPVCGADGQTYGNACGAASEGVNVVSEGECPPIDPDGE